MKTSTKAPAAASKAPARTPVKTLVLCALCAALICILAPFSIPLPGGVPLSLATFAVMLAGVLLGAKFGTVSTLLYLLLGSVGVPVFSSFTGGFSHIATMTGGYLVGYLPLAFFSGLIYHLLGRKKNGFAKLFWMAAGMLAGTVVLYLLGTIWFCAISKMTFGAALAVCVIPFLPGDAIKIIAIMLLVPQLERVLAKTGSM